MFTACRRLKKLHWRSFIDRIQKRLAGWKEKLLSLRGRITLKNVILFVISIYFLSFFPLPR